jgi:hypothetical protein
MLHAMKFSTSFQNIFYLEYFYPNFGSEILTNTAGFAGQHKICRYAADEAVQ